MSDPQSWFRQLQQQITERVGEPALLTIRMCFDEWFEVEVQTFTDRWGMAAGRDVQTAVESATDMLLEMDDVVAEVVAAKEGR
jgi:hypothetical protein